MLYNSICAIVLHFNPNLNLKITRLTGELP